MSARRALSAVLVTAATVVVLQAAPAHAENGPPPPFCPDGSWVVFDWPGGTVAPDATEPAPGVYVPIPGLPLGCFSSWCPEGQSKISPYADGRDPNTVQGPYREWSQIDGASLRAADNGTLRAGCTFADGSIIPAPGAPTGDDDTTTGFSTGTGSVNAPTQVLSGSLTAVPTAAQNGVVAQTGTVAGVEVASDTQVLSEAVTRGATRATTQAAPLPRTGGEPLRLVTVGGLLVAAGLALAAAGVLRRRQAAPAT